MNKTIYLTTIKKILKRKFILGMLFAMGLVVPLSSILSPEAPSITTVEGWDAFAVSTVIGIITVTASNSIGNALSVGGRSDYMPLIVTRPIHRYQYVISKWLALATIIAIASILQHILFSISGTYTKWGLTDDMIMIGFFERLVSALCVSSVLTMIYLLPSQGMVLCGIIAFEVATGINILSLSLTIPMPESAVDVTELLATILGIEPWAKTVLLPALFGGNALSSVQQYASVVVGLSNFLAPQVYLYDILKTQPFVWSALLEPVSNVLIALTIATAVLNSREYHYDSD